MVGGRNFYGFASQQASKKTVAYPRQCIMINVLEGDLVRLSFTHEYGQYALLAFDENGQRQEERLGWDNPELISLVPLDFSKCEMTALQNWLAACGGDELTPPSALVMTIGNEDVILRPQDKMTLWLVNLQSGAALVNGDGSGIVSVWHQAQNKQIMLPPPLGTVRDEFTVKRGTACAYELSAGEQVQIIDVEGQQCSDFQSLSLTGLDAGTEDVIDSTATRSMVRRAYPAPGLFDKFYDAEMRPLLRVVQDTCGRHDTFGLALQGAMKKEATQVI